MIIKKILYGASIHPGNPFYLIILLGTFAAGLKNETAPWWFGLIAWPLVGVLYIWTSYSVGKANWPPKKDIEQ